MGKNRQHGFRNWGLLMNTPLINSSYFESPSKNTNPNIQKNTGYRQFDFLQKFVFTLPREKQLLINLQFLKLFKHPKI